MAVIKVTLPDAMAERLESESRYSGETVDNILTRALMMYFSQNQGGDEEQMPAIRF